MSSQPVCKKCKRTRVNDGELRCYMCHLEYQVTPSCGNVFRDLGLPDAERLLAEADAKIIAGLQAKHTAAMGVIAELVGALEVALRHDPKLDDIADSALAKAKAFTAGEGE